MTIFARLLADRRRAAAWWALGMVAGVASIVGLWPSVENNSQIEDVVKGLPTGVQALIGNEPAISFTSAPGYLQARLFSTVLPILLLVYAIGLGARAIGGAEEDGTLQLVVVSPLTRRRIAVERMAGSITLVLGLVAVGAVTTIALGAAVGVFATLSVGRVLVETAAITELALLHLAIAFAAGAATGRRGPALAAAGAVAVGTYVLHGVAAAAPAVRPLRVASPWWWLLDRNLLVHDPTFLAVGLPLLVAAITFACGLAAYERRDLRFP
jgi:ABC-2 type transport system permease protein